MSGAYGHGTTENTKRLPPWLRRPIARSGEFLATEDLLSEMRLNTVCRSAKCPNRGECYASGTATFLVLGDACTRGCRFCAVEARVPAAAGLRRAGAGGRGRAGAWGFATWW